jgi:hypothetical protein
MAQNSILLNISIFSILVPVFAGIFRLRILSRELKLLVFYLIYGFIIAIVISLFFGNKWIMMVLHISTLIEFVIMMLIIWTWQESKKMKRLLNIILLSYIPFWIFSKIVFEPISGLYPVSASIYQAILALSAGYTLFVVIENYTQSLLQYARFWILIALILNYTGTLLPTSLVGVIFTKPGEDVNLLYSINWILVIISNILFTIGLLCPPVRQ